MADYEYTDDRDFDAMDGDSPADEVFMNEMKDLDLDKITSLATNIALSITPGGKLDPKAVRTIAKVLKKPTPKPKKAPVVKPSSNVMSLAEKKIRNSIVNKNKEALERILFNKKNNTYQPTNEYNPGRIFTNPNRGEVVPKTTFTNFNRGEVVPLTTGVKYKDYVDPKTIERLKRLEKFFVNEGVTTQMPKTPGGSGILDAITAATITGGMAAGNYKMMKYFEDNRDYSGESMEIDMEPDYSGESTELPQYNMRGVVRPSDLPNRSRALEPVDIIRGIVRESDKELF